MERRVTREGLRIWYDGYYTKTGKRLYNPRSIVVALENNQLGSYWTSAGPYDEIFYYIEHNIADIRDALALLISGETVKADVQEYAATAMKLTTRDEIFSAMVVYGFLSRNQGRVSIPNRELMLRFSEMLKREPKLGDADCLAKESERMLQATRALDTKTIAEILSHVHDSEVPLWDYNREVRAYGDRESRLIYRRRDEYDIQRREDRSGKGYVDFIFYPRYDRHADCIIVELKVDHSAGEAVEQIEQKNLTRHAFVARLAEETGYTGRNSGGGDCV